MTTSMLIGMGLTYFICFMVTLTVCYKIETDPNEAAMCAVFNPIVIPCAIVVWITSWIHDKINQ